MLDRAARQFINHPRAVRVIDGKLRVSSIYVWFKDDFGGDDAAVIRHLRQYANGKLAADLKDIRRIDDDHYDWNLNSVSDLSAVNRLRDQTGN
jgi:hypothetical protein